MQEELTSWVCVLLVLHRLASEKWWLALFLGKSSEWFKGERRPRRKRAKATGDNFSQSRGSCRGEHRSEIQPLKVTAWHL